MVSAAESIFQNIWTQQLNMYPGLPVSEITSRGVTGFRDLLTGEQLDQAVAAAAYAIQRTLVVPIAAASLASFTAWGLEWKSIKGKAMAAGGA